MSRGFVKEEDQEEPVLVPPRAALPEGVTNYVTENGLQELKTELKQLEKSRAEVIGENETEKRRTQSLIDGKINLLTERLNTARLLTPEELPKDEVRFGARLQFQNITTNQKQEFQIVGVDEANVKLKKIAFVAPIARAVTGKKEGEIAEFKLGEEVKKLKILKVTY
ncbi:GreA/GreB family elongation factor [Gramella lutea]|uniref:GreA/GreB family elongation factor n=1 Tax=Christiangramia lutea TaxID=1607951 RepID=A0A9X2AB44_9FLAO|nr:GreA/GreB family elongation factor [Christiangramia lutea]MCH4823077.1 GreA/GreB family elongation factor [Christiangramia lutea]